MVMIHKSIQAAGISVTAQWYKDPAGTAFPVLTLAEKYLKEKLRV